MKKFRLITLLLLMLLLAACESGSQFFDNQSAPSEEVYQTEMVMDSEANLTRQENTEDRDVIYTASVRYQTVNYEDAKTSINDIITANDGFIQYQDESKSEYRYTDSSQNLTDLYLTVRVPQENYEAILTAFEENETAQLMQLSRGSQDVTSHVQDIEIRIASVEARIDRLNELNEQAETITDLIEIQAALEEAIAERDLLLADQAAITDEVDYATINLSLQEVIELSDRSQSQLTFWDRVVQAFSDTWQNSIDAFEWGVLTLIFLIPYIIMILIVIFIIRFIIRPLFRKLMSTISRKKNKNNHKVTQEENSNNT